MRTAVVVFQSEQAAKDYVDEGKLAWPLLIDEGRELYTEFAMSRGSWLEVLGPAAWWIYFKLLARGRRLRPATGDVWQLGGNVLIDPEGFVRLHHVGRGPADRPTVDALLDVVREATGP